MAAIANICRAQRYRLRAVNCSQVGGITDDAWDNLNAFLAADTTPARDALNDRPYSMFYLEYLIFFLGRLGHSVKCFRISLAVSLALHFQPHGILTPGFPATSDRPPLACCAASSFLLVFGWTLLIFVARA